MSEQYRRFSLWLVFLVFVALASPAAQPLLVAQERPASDTARVWQAVVAARGSNYVVGRDFIISHLDRFRELIADERTSQDWRRRDFALAMELRAQQPKKVALWMVAVRGQRKINILSDDKVELVIPKDDVAATLRLVPESGKVEMTRDALPFLNEQLRAVSYHLETGHRNRTQEWRNLLSLLQHFRSSSSADVLADLVGRLPRESEAVDACIVAHGKSILPTLRKVLASSPDHASYRKGGAASDSATVYRGIQRSIKLASLLARMQDQDARPVLHKKIQASPTTYQLGAFLTALAKLRDGKTVPVALDLLERLAALQKARPSSQQGYYYQVRDAVLACGDRALAELQRRAASDQPALRRAIAMGLLHELNNSEAMKTFYERVYTNMLTVHGVRMRLRAGQTKESVGRDWSWRHGRYTRGLQMPIAVRRERSVALAESHDLAIIAGSGEAIDVEIAALSLERSGSHVPVVLASLGRTRQEIALQPLKRLATRPWADSYATAIAEAVLEIRSRKGIAVLDALDATIVKRATPKQRQELQASVAAVRNVLAGESELLGLLSNQRPGIRRIAAKILARDGEIRSLPVLLEEAENVRGAEFESLRRHVGLLGGRALPALRRLSREENLPWRRRLLLEVNQLLIEKPELLKKLQQSKAWRRVLFQKRAGPGIADYRTTGYRLADHLGPDAVPLLESTILFESDQVGLGVAVFALARLGKPRSIPACVEAMKKRIYERGGAIVAAEALAEFGEAGRAAAKKVNPPDPRLAAFSARSRRRRGGTAVLIKKGDPQALENVLRGLKDVYRRTDKLPAGTFDEWKSRTLIYVRMARELREPKLIPSLITLGKHEDHWLSLSALEALIVFKHPDITELALSKLKHPHTDIREAALSLVISCNGKSAPELIATQIDDPNSKEALYIAEGMNRILHNRTYSAITAAGLKQAEFVQAAQPVFRVALTKLLESDQRPVRLEAARALSSFGWRHRSIVELLANHAAKESTPHADVIAVLKGCELDIAKTALLACYRESKLRNGAVGVALAGLQYQPAFDDLKKGLRQALASKDTDDCSLQLEAMARMGKEGFPLLKEVAVGDYSIQRRVRAVRLLASYRQPGAFEVSVKLMDEIVEKEGGHPDLQDSRNEKVKSQRIWGLVRTLVDAMVNVDRQRAYDELSRVSLKPTNEQTRAILASRALSLRRQLKLN